MKKGPVDTTHSPHAQWRTLPLDSVSLQKGFWSDRQTINLRVSLRHGYEQLAQFGNFNNLELAAGAGTGAYRTPVFMDSDVYKWLEAVGYELAGNPDPELQRMAGHAVELVQAAQAEDGYLNSYWQVVEPERRWADLEHGHELYCAGHLFQSAVAYYRATGDSRLLDVSRRFADNIDAVFGPQKRAGTPGHPEIEMALVELYRETGERRYLDLALYFTGQRGRQLLDEGRHGGRAYYQDHVPVRDATTMEGHAVRQLYLTTGMADLYLETGEQALLDALVRQWRDMVSHKLYITGAVGSQHAGEAFGEPYELPNERGYCETCAQIASVMWNWRMLLITGEGRFADLIERTLYNGFLSGISLDGRCYFYVNPLLSHGRDPWLGRKHVVRPEWHACACCPPNVMRLLASLQHYVATWDEDGVQIHQYTPATVKAEANGRPVAFNIETDYPWQGTVRLTVAESHSGPWTLRLRVPSWSDRASGYEKKADAWTLRVNGEQYGEGSQNGYVAIERTWQPGDTVELDLEIEPRLMEANPRVDATRASVAIQRGPLVYCLEEVDQEAGVDLLDVRIDAAAPLSSRWQSDLLGGVAVVEGRGRASSSAGWEGRLFRPLGSGPDNDRRAVKLTAVPYYAWANRGANPMRVWIPYSQTENAAS